MDLGKITCNARKTCLLAGLFVMISCKVVSHVVDIDLPTRHTFEREVYHDGVKPSTSGLG